MPPQPLILFGSTGSLGSQVFDVLSKYPKKFKIIALACDQNIDQLQNQIKLCQPVKVGIFNQKKAKFFQKKNPTPLIIGTKIQQLIDLDQNAVIVNAISGDSGLPITLAAIKKKKNLILANKESLILAGPKIIKIIAQKNITFKLLDSEHSAINQLLSINKKSSTAIEQLILPCSGGPFWGTSQLSNINLKKALNHPTWKNMGQKITIDSATLMNKAFELIESIYLYHLRPDQIKILIHPEAKVHAIIKFKNADWQAVVGENTMKEAILWTFGLPPKNKIIKAKTLPALFKKLPKLHYQILNPVDLPALNIALRALKRGSTTVKKLCQINSLTVDQFLRGQISWPEIFEKLTAVVLDKD